MKKSRTVFGNNAEQKAFATITDSIPRGFRLDHNLPLSQLVEMDRNELSESEWEFYLKTSVDFVLVNCNSEPIVAIEFDGISGGFNSGVRYRPARYSRDPNRSAKIEFKLALCKEAGLPLYVSTSSLSNK